MTLMYAFNVEKSMKRLSHHYLFASLSLHGTMRQVKTFKMTTGAIYQIIIIIFNRWHWYLFMENSNFEAFIPHFQYLHLYILKSSVM